MSLTLLDQGGTEFENLSRRERTNLQQREEILNTALRLFSEKGYRNVAMHEVAREARYGMGTVYKYFKNKDELYKALVMGVSRKFHQDLMASIEQERDPIQAISNYVVVRQKLFSDNLPFMRLYFAETRGASFNIKAGFDRDMVKLYEDGMGKLACVFEQGIRDGVFRDLDPYQMALALEGTISALLFQFLEHPDRVHEEDVVLTATDIFFRGVLRQ